MSETPRPRTGVDPVDTASRRGDGRVSQPETSRAAFSTPMARYSLCIVDSELYGVHSRGRCCFANCLFARIVLLELNRRAHSVITGTDTERRGLLAHLECAIAALDHMGSP
jgi:hypothetical protein